MKLSNLILSLMISVSLLACAQPEPRKPLQKRSGSFMEKSAQRNKALYAQEEAEIKNFISTQDSLRNYRLSESGFWYAIESNNAPQLSTAKKGDTVVFTYSVYDLSLNQLISAQQNGWIEYQVDQSNQELVNGVREGIKLTRDKDSVRLLLPSVLAYGYRGIPGVIAPNTPVVIDLVRQN